MNCPTVGLLQQCPLGFSLHCLIVTRHFAGIIRSYDHTSMYTDAFFTLISGTSDSLPGLYFTGGIIRVDVLILVTEDEEDMARAVASGLRKHGFAVDIAADGDQALFLFEVNDYDLVILDLNLPGVDGMEVCRQIRSTGSAVGVLMLTARAGFGDRIMGLEEGADDYLVKPFHFPELLARVRAILRRKSEPRHTLLRKNGLVVEPNSLKVYFMGKDALLTLKEFAILEYLVRNTGRVISQEEILEHAWGEDSNAFTQVVKVHINNTRRKLSAIGAGEVIQTVKGKGYMV